MSAFAASNLVCLHPAARPPRPRFASRCTCRPRSAGGWLGECVRQASARSSRRRLAEVGGSDEDIKASSDDSSILNPEGEEPEPLSRLASQPTGGGQRHSRSSRRTQRRRSWTPTPRIPFCCAATPTSAPELRLEQLAAIVPHPSSSFTARGGRARGLTGDRAGSHLPRVDSN